MDTRLLNIRTLIKFFTKGDTNKLIEDYNDLFCLFLSQIVYFSEPFIEKYLTQLGSTSVSIVKYDGPRAVCLHINDVNYVSVKGLSGRNKEEWPIILNFLAKEFEGTEAHGGFVLTARKLIPHVKEFLAVHPGNTVLTGHSMGGALATLTCLAVSGCKIVTFGSPKTVEKDALKAFTAWDLNHYRINTDFVTHLPPFIYERPGKHITKRKRLNLLRFWDNHKLYTYSQFINPDTAIESVAMALALHTAKANRENSHVQLLLE